MYINHDHNHEPPPLIKPLAPGFPRLNPLFLRHKGPRPRPPYDPGMSSPENAPTPTIQLAQEVRTEIEQETNEQLSSVDQEVIYRGSSLPRLNRDEFVQNAIDGKAIDVWDATADMKELEDAGPSLTAIHDLPWKSIERSDVPVTGGLTDRLGVAAFFGQESGQLPTTLYLDTNRVEGDVFEVMYGYNWFNQHPGVLAWIDTLTHGELYVNGNLLGLVDFNNEGVPFIQHWGKDRMIARAQSPTYITEREIVAITQEIDLDQALLGVGSFYTDLPGTSVEPKHVLNEQDGYDLRPRLGSDDEDISVMTQEEVIEVLHDLWTDQSKLVPDVYWSIVLGQNVRDTKALSEITDEELKFAYDGTNFVDKARQLPEFLTGRMG